MTDLKNNELKIMLKHAHSKTDRSMSEEGWIAYHIALITR